MMRESQVQSLGREDPLEKEMATHSSTLAWKIPWTEVRDIVQETGIKTIPMEKKCKKAKWLSEEALQIAVKRREAKNKRRKGKIYPLKAEFQRYQGEIRKPSSVINAKK